MQEDAGPGLRPVPIKATSALIADQLRDRIVDGTFPPGTQMIEGQLSQQLGVSRGPVREALQRLIQEGLLTSLRNRGVFVVEFGPDDVVEIYDARRAIERFAALELHRDKPADHLEELAGIVGKMRQAARVGNPQKLAAWDIAFHDALVRSSRNRRLSRMFSTLMAETQICMSTVSSKYTQLSDLVDEHQQLLDVIQTGTKSAVLKVIDEHLKSAVTALTKDGARATSGN